MDYCPDLQRQQRSCACPALDVGSWCNSRRRTAGFARTFATDDYYDDDDEEFDPFNCRPLTVPSTTTGTRRLRGLWRRILKEKRRILSTANPAAHVPYDPYTYAQNFDEGSASVEPDNLSRSFSARFAGVPSRMMQRNRADIHNSHVELKMRC